jgi:hypothetical protein
MIPPDLLPEADKRELRSRAGWVAAGAAIALVFAALLTWCGPQ